MDKLTMMLAAALILASGPSPGYADQAERCRTIEAPAERLACYDRLHGRPETEPQNVAKPPPRSAGSIDAETAVTSEAPTAPETAVPPPTDRPHSADPPRPAGRPEESFGAEQLPSRAAPREQIDLEAVVVSAGEGMTGRRWYRLDGGQLWEQVTPRRTGIAAGDTVQITRSPLGTYHIRRADGSSRSSQVRRRE